VDFNFRTHSISLRAFSSTTYPSLCESSFSNLQRGSFDNNDSPKSQAEFDQYQAAMTNFISAAIRDSTPPGIMQHVGTIEYIQDLDSLRAALGYEKLNFEGIS
jgi:hypothetical protein